MQDLASETGGSTPATTARPSRVLFSLGAPAAFLACALIVVSLLAARALRQRDDAVRDGVLYRLAHELEAELREAGPEAARAVLDEYSGEHREELAAAELVGPQGVVASYGTLSQPVHEIPMALGPNWRPGGPPQGSGMGVGQGGRLRGWQMHPYRLRLQPSDELGSAGELPALLVAGAAIAAAALLGLTFSAMTGLLQRQRLAIAEAERRRLESVSLAGAGLAHRIRNPLATIKGTAQFLSEKLEPPVRERVERIVDASQRIEALITRLLEFARPPAPRPESVDVEGLVREVAARTTGSVKVSARGSPRVSADREHLYSVLEELLRNARAWDPQGELEISLGRDGNMAFIEVRDRGPGLSLDSEKAFEPYVTSRSDGTGLGLSIVRALLRANGGEVRLLARDAGGCIARVVLPAQG